MFPFRPWNLAPWTDSCNKVNGIRSLVRFGNLVGPLAHPVLYPVTHFARLYLNIFRGEPAISKFVCLSPLSTAHPSIFQHTTVRASTRFYSRFTLAMDRSLGFGPTPRNYFAQLRLAFATATPVGLTSLRKVTR